MKMDNLDVVNPYKSKFLDRFQLKEIGLPRRRPEFEPGKTGTKAAYFE